LQQIKFGVVIIVYPGKLRKSQKDKTISAKRWLRMGKVLASLRVHLKTVPLIKRAKGCGFFKMFIFSKNKKTPLKKKQKKIIIFGSDNDVVRF